MGMGLFTGTCTKGHTGQGSAGVEEDSGRLGSVEIDRVDN